MSIVATACFISCQGGDKKTTDSGDKKDSTKTESSESKAPAGAKYGIKSGMLEMKSTTMGIEQKIVTYFDDFGKKESQTMTMEMMGIKSENIVIIKDGFQYDVDMTKKVAKKKKLLTTEDPNNLNFTSMTEDVMKKMNIKKEGTETFLSKTCDKYTMDYKEMGMKGTYLVWNGIALKTDMEMSGLKVILQATKIEENPTIPQGKFDVPAGVTVQEVK